MKFTYNPTKKNILGWVTYRKIHIYIYILSLHHIYNDSNANKERPKKKFLHTFKRKNKKKFQKNFYKQKKFLSFKQKNSFQTKKFIHSKKKIKKNFHQNIKIHRFNQNIKKSMKNEVHPTPQNHHFDPILTPF